MAKPRRTDGGQRGNIAHGSQCERIPVDARTALAFVEYKRKERQVTPFFDDPLGIPCPECKAPIGKACDRSRLSPSVREHRRNHIQRVNTAKRKGKEERLLESLKDPVTCNAAESKK